MVHLETRPSKQPGTQFDILVKVDMSKQNLLVLIRSLRQSSALDGVTLLQENTTSVSVKGNRELRVLIYFVCFKKLFYSNQLNNFIFNCFQTRGSLVTLVTSITATIS